MDRERPGIKLNISRLSISHDGKRNQMINRRDSGYSSRLIHLKNGRRKRRQIQNYSIGNIYDSNSSELHDSHDKTSYHPNFQSYIGALSRVFQKFPKPNETLPKVQIQKHRRALSMNNKSLMSKDENTQRLIKFEESSLTQKSSNHEVELKVLEKFMNSKKTDNHTLKNRRELLRQKNNPRIQKNQIFRNQIYKKIKSNPQDPFAPHWKKPNQLVIHKYNLKINNKGKNKKNFYIERIQLEKISTKNKVNAKWEKKLKQFKNRKYKFDRLIRSFNGIQKYYDYSILSNGVDLHDHKFMSEQELRDKFSYD